MHARLVVHRLLDAVLRHADNLDYLDVCGELLNLAENIAVAQSCESSTYR
jgi:hypothetical protein